MVVADVDGRLVAVVVQQLQGGLSRLSDAARRLSWKCQVPLLPGDEDDEPGLFLLARLLVSLPALLQVLHHQPPICSFSAAQRHFCCTSPSPWRDVGSVRVVSRAAITFRLTPGCKLVRLEPDKVKILITSDFKVALHLIFVGRSESLISLNV